MPGMTSPACSAPGCTHPSRARGLCVGHHRQQLRGKPLSPLRQRQVEGDALAMLPIRFPASVVAAARRDPAGARAALLAWATKLALSQEKAAPSPEHTAEAKIPTKKRKAKAAACARCGMPATAPIHGTGPSAQNTHPFSPGRKAREAGGLVPGPTEEAAPCGPRR
jgi:hypothetical protein